MTCQPQGPNFTQGQLLTIIGIFRDASEALIDPTTVSLIVKTPDGTITTFLYGSSAIVKDATGNYHYDYSIVQAGQYYYRWVGTGVCQTSQPDVPFFVPPSVLIPTTG